MEVIADKKTGSSVGEKTQAEEGAVCDECGYEKKSVAAGCARCGAVPGAVVPQKVLSYGEPPNPHDVEFERIKAEISEGTGFDSDLENYMTSVECKAEEGDALAQEFLGRRALGEKDPKRAAWLFRCAAESGNSFAEYALGWMHKSGEGVEKDLYAAVRFYRKAAAKGEPQAIWALAEMYSRGECLVRDDAKATSLVRVLADAGYPIAQYEMSRRYYHGIGVNKDLGQALVWCSLAANAGHAGAESMLARFYDVGEGVRQDEAEALKWLERASAHGDLRASLDLSIRYCQGIGTAKNPGRAYYLAYEAADRGYEEAYWQVGYYFRYGIGVKQDDRRADKWLLKALDSNASMPWNGNKPETAEKEFPCRMKWAGEDSDRLVKVTEWTRISGYDSGSREVLQKGVALGYPWAQNTLGVAFQEGGLGLKKDIFEALRLYKLAADAGEASALCNLGMLYQEGNGVERDLAMAERLYRRAIAAGNVASERNLAWQLWEKNTKEAVSLMESAASKGDLSAMSWLGFCLVRGDKMPKDVDRGMRMLESAGLQGKAEAWSLLGDLHSAGEHLQRDYNLAFSCYERAAQGGCSEAYRIISEYYASGLGCPQDNRKAMEALQTSIELGNELAMCRFGELLRDNGEYDKALEWFEKSWKAGCATGRYQMALMHWRGEGVPQNAHKAIRIAEEAVAAGAEDLEGLCGPRVESDGQAAKPGRRTDEDASRPYGTAGILPALVVIILVLVVLCKLVASIN